MGSGSTPSGDTWSAASGAAGAPSGDTWAPASDTLGGTSEPASAYASAPTGTAYGAEIASYGRGSGDSTASPNGANGGRSQASEQQQQPLDPDGVPAAPPLKDDATVADGTAVIPPAPAIDPGATPAHLPGGPGVPGSPGPGGLPIRLPHLPGFRRRGEHDSARQRGKGLRVRQRLWNVDPWSVFKVSALFYLCLFFILLVAGTLLWNIGRSSGTIDQFESFVTRLGAYGSCAPEADLPDGAEFENDDDCPDGEVLIDGFELDDGTIFRAAAIGGVVLVLAGSVGNVLMTVLLNLINEVTGGTRYTIIKEPTPRAPSGGGAGGAGGPPPDGEARSPRVRMRR